MSPAKSRRYESPLRQETAARTRRRVVEVASRLFVERGWEGASMRDVAREAGCSVETVYASVGNKTALLKTVLDIAVVGDDAQIALDDRPWFGVGEGPLATRVAALAEVSAGIYRRTAELRRVLDSAARSNAELAQLDAGSRAQERISRTALVSAAAGRPLTELEADAVQSVFSNEIYRLLTTVSGWSHAQYQQWAADAIVRLLDLHEE
ncbi:TetR/AcrR family transcriptional regulator [Nocardia sp. NPDC056611]|uniref:TetR/AcrR family transcriptional regulator n=1 Tax=Nocardia sp. NPDC056611 TaxID=3345877 RepID=UPI00366FA215